MAYRFQHSPDGEARGDQMNASSAANQSKSGILAGGLVKNIMGATSLCMWVALRIE